MKTKLHCVYIISFLLISFNVYSQDDCSSFFMMDSSPIPDADPIGLSSIIDVTSPIAISDINVTIDITHTFVGDLEITLINPSGDVIILSELNGDSGENYTMTIFDDDATNPITSGMAPFTGSFTPEEPLSIFNGENSLGEWVLSVRDLFTLDNGVLNSWSIEICGEVLSTESFTRNEVSFYPNPAKNVLTIDFVSQGTDNNYTIFNALGQQINSGSLSLNKTDINVEHLHTGIYFVAINDNVTSNTKTFKFIKE